MGLNEVENDAKKESEEAPGHYLSWLRAAAGDVTSATERELWGNYLQSEFGTDEFWHLRD